MNQLSDGYRTTLALVVDLACRMVEANPPADDFDPLHTEAIVLIDEIDLHLPPEWQQTILPDLHRVFPGVQWIVTTHSAQVLTTVEARCIRTLKKTSRPNDGQHPGLFAGCEKLAIAGRHSGR